MKKVLSVLLALLFAALLQTGCVSSDDAIRDATFARADFQIRDPFVLAENGTYSL